MEYFKLKGIIIHTPKIITFKNENPKSYKNAFNNGQSIGQGMMQFRMWRRKMPFYSK